MKDFKLTEWYNDMVSSDKALVDITWDKAIEVATALRNEKMQAYMHQGGDWMVHSVNDAIIKGMDEVINFMKECGAQ